MIILYLLLMSVSPMYTKTLTRGCDCKTFQTEKLPVKFKSDIERTFDGIFDHRFELVSTFNVIFPKHFYRAGDNSVFTHFHHSLRCDSSLHVYVVQSTHRKRGESWRRNGQQTAGWVWGGNRRGWSWGLFSPTIGMALDKNGQKSGTIFFIRP